MQTTSIKLLTIYHLTKVVKEHAKELDKAFLIDFAKYSLECCHTESTSDLLLCAEPLVDLQLSFDFEVPSYDFQVQFYIFLVLFKKFMFYHKFEYVLKLQELCMKYITQEFNWNKEFFYTQ